MSALRNTVRAFMRGDLDLKYALLYARGDEARAAYLAARLMNYDRLPFTGLCGTPARQLDRAYLRRQATVSGPRYTSIASY